MPGVHRKDNSSAPTKCDAKSEATCPYGNSEKYPEAHHYATMEEAEAAYERDLEAATEGAQTLGNGGKQEEEKSDDYYSFTDRFKKMEAEYDAANAGIPKSFHKANLDMAPGKTPIYDERQFERLRSRLTPEQMDDLSVHVNSTMNTSYAVDHYAKILSSTKDRALSDEDTMEAMRNLGMTDVRKLDEAPEALNKSASTATKGSTRFFTGKFAGLPVVVGDGDAGAKFKRVRFRYMLHGSAYEFLDGERTIWVTDTRALAGLSRLQEKADINPLIAHNDQAYNNSPHITRGLKDSDKDLKSLHYIGQGRDHKLNPTAASLIQGRLTRQRMVYDMRNALSREQDRQLNFEAQRKHVRESNSSIATAWTDKKNADKKHQEMMKNTSLNKHFSKVELDNDVEEDKWQNFEKDYNEFAQKMPAFDKEHQPTLRVRKLGKHSSNSFRVNGMYSPGHNTVAIDIQTSSSTVHEMGHFLDMQVKNNASLQEDFAPVIKGYRKNLKTPEGLGKKRDYYETPTEVLARGWTVYAHERLGVKNSRLLDERDLDKFDHEPFKDPELKAATFRFFDKWYENQRK